MGCGRKSVWRCRERTGSMAGRKRQLTPQTHHLLIRAIQHGLSNADAAKAIGVSESAFYKWVEKGEKETSGPYFQLVEAIKQAEAQFIKANLDRLIRARDEPQKHVKKVVKVDYVTDPQTKKKVEVARHEEITEEVKPSPWQISAWLLERKKPEEYGRRVEDINLKQTGPRPVIQIEFLLPGDDRVQKDEPIPIEDQTADTLEYSVEPDLEPASADAA